MISVFVNNPLLCHFNTLNIPKYVKLMVIINGCSGLKDFDTFTLPCGRWAIGGQHELSFVHPAYLNWMSLVYLNDPFSLMPLSLFIYRMHLVTREKNILAPEI